MSLAGPGLRSGTAEAGGRSGNVLRAAVSGAGPLSLVPSVPPLPQLSPPAGWGAPPGPLPLAHAGLPDPQPPAHPPVSDLLGGGARRGGPRVRRRLQVLLAIQGSRLHHPGRRRRRHLRPHLGY